jgi:hypothetical protein
VLVKDAVSLLATITGTLRGAAPSLACYYAICIVIPLAHEEEIHTALLAEHMVFVALVPVALLSLVGALRGFLRVARARRRLTSP